MPRTHRVVLSTQDIKLMPPNGDEVGMKTINGKTMLSTKEAAEYLGLNENTLRYWRHLADGTGPKSFRIGKKLVHYAIDDLDQWLQDQYDRTVTA